MYLQVAAVGLSFVPAPPAQPDYTQAVLVPLRAAQAAELAKSQLEAQQLAQQQAEVAKQALIASQTAPVYNGNNYDFGECTWYVASQIAVPSSLGNANQWAVGLANAGWSVSNLPTVGAIAITQDGSLGHVAIVIGLGDGQVLISEMNATAGWDAIDQRWVPTGEFVYATR